MKSKGLMYLTGLALLLAACGGGDDTTSEPDEPETATTQAAPATTADAADNETTDPVEAEALKLYHNAVHFTAVRRGR